MASRIPQAPEAEAAVLGAVLLRNAAFDDDGVADLQPDDFHIPRHAKAWEAMRTLLHEGHAVDIVTLEDQLQSTGDLGTVGGLEGIAKLADRVFVSHNVSAHARIVAAKARARRAQRVLAEAVDKLAVVDADDLDDFLAETQGELAQAESGHSSGLVTIGACVDAAFEDAKARASGRLKPFAWGLPRLDAIYDGGMMPGELVIVAARPGMGKTVLGMQVAFNSSSRGEEPIVFSLEMMRQQLGRRAIATLGEVNLKDAKAPSTERGWLRLADAREFFARSGCKVWPRRIHLDRLIAEARSWRRKTRRPGPVVIDYLQLLDVVGRGRLDKRERVEVTTRELKLLAMELEVPVVLISQLNRDLEKREDKRPKLADLRDSGSIEQDADSVVFLYRPAKYEPNAPPMAAEAIVEKCREGVPGTAHITFEGHFSRFVDTSNDFGNEAGWEYRP